MTIALLCAAVAALEPPVAPSTTFEFTGSYVEGCSCAGPCPCELTGVEMGCQGIGVFNVEKGSYKGKDMSGSRFAYATAPGDWIAFYIDAPNASKRAVVEGFMKEFLGPFGKLSGTHDAKIKLTIGRNKQYARVDDGKVMSIESTSVLGGDKKTPLTYSNINDPIHPVVMQGKVVSCYFNGDGKKFNLKGTNAYFNGKIKSSQ